MFCLVNRPPCNCQKMVLSICGAFEAYHVKMIQEDKDTDKDDISIACEGVGHALLGAEKQVPASFVPQTYPVKGEWQKEACKVTQRATIFGPTLGTIMPHTSLSAASTILSQKPAQPHIFYAVPSLTTSSTVRPTAAQQGARIRQ
jgi:hypothetical protein